MSPRPYCKYSFWEHWVKLYQAHASTDFSRKHVWLVLYWALLIGTRQLIVLVNCCYSMLVCKAILFCPLSVPKSASSRLAKALETSNNRREENAFMHIFILNKKLVFCFAKAQNSSLEQIPQEWFQACSLSWRTPLPLTIYLGKLWFRATWKQGKEFIAVTVITSKLISRCI